MMRADQHDGINRRVRRRAVGRPLPRTVMSTVSTFAQRQAVAVRNGAVRRDAVAVKRECNSRGFGEAP